MKELLPLLVIDLVLFTSMGLVVIAWLPTPWRGALIAGTPTLGAAVLVVALHLTSLFVGVRAGTAIVLVTAVASLIVRSLRCRWWRALGRSSWMLLATALIAGALPLVFVIQPFRAAGATVVQPTTNDAYYYVSLTDWLVERSALTAPMLSDPPAYENARATLKQGLRIGEELNEGAVATVTARDPVSTWSTTILMWLLFIPGACVAAFAVLGLHRVAGLVAGLLTAGSAVVAAQVLAQNSAALLGILLAPLAIALWASYFAPRGRGPSHRASKPTAPAAVGEVDSPPPVRPPLWLAALAFDALVGAYTEYLPIIGLGLLVYLALRSPGLWVRATVDVLKLGGLAVAIGPLIWYDAARSLLFTSTLGGGYAGSPFLGESTRTWIARLTGTSPYYARTGLTLGVLLAGWLLAGICLAALWSPARRILGPVLLNFIVIALILGSSLHYFAYGEFRAVEVGVSLLLITSVAGWEAGLLRLGRSTKTIIWIAPAIAVVAGGAGLFFVLNQRTVAKQAVPDPTRTVTPDFGQAAAWAASTGGPGGAEVSALIPDFYTQLWSMYELRRLPKVNFPFLYEDYTRIPPLTYYDGRLRRYVLVGGDLFTQVDRAVVVGGNSRFQYLDVSRGTTLLAFGVGDVQNIEITAQHRVQQWMVNDGQLLVAHTSDVRSVTLTLRANPVLASIPVTISADGRSGRDYIVGQADVSITIPLSSSTISLIQIHNRVRAVPTSPDDPRGRSVLVEAIRAG